MIVNPYRYTSRFRGRSVPLPNRAAHAARAIATFYIVALEWSSIIGKRPSRRPRATTFLNDVSNSTHGSGLEVANRIICIVRRRQTREFDSSRADQGGSTKSSETDEVVRVLCELKSHGRSVIRGFVPDSEARAIAEEVRKMPGRCDLATRRYDSMHSWMEDEPAEPRFHTDGGHLAVHPTIASLCRSDLVQEIARQYLGAAPLLASLQSWTTRPPTTGMADELDAAAMAYHCDSDFFGFLKFFVLLTDVGPENGPFTFIEKSHRGTRHVAGRMPDSEVVGPDDVEFKGTGRPGDLVIVDTKGWHKASEPISGYRSMLQFVYASSLFGSPT